MGRFIGSTQLGFYSRAYNLMLVPVYALETIMSRVMFSAFSRIQNDIVQVKRVYVRSLGLVAVLAFPISVGLFVVARPFILTVYGPRWAPVIPLLQILCIPCLLQCLFRPSGLIFTSQGRADLFFRWGVVSTVVVVLSFIIGLHWGVRGVATAYACANVLTALPYFRASGQLIDVSLFDMARILVGVAGAALIMGIVVSVFEKQVPHAWGSASQLVLGVMVGIVTYLLALHIISPKPYGELRRLMAEHQRR